MAGSLWVSEVRVGTAGAEGGKAGCFGGRESVDCDAEGRAMVKAAPAASLERIPPEPLFRFLVSSNVEAITPP